MKVVSIHKVLEKAGGAARLQETLYRSGQPYPSHQTLANWKARGMIPGWWVGAIVWALACKGVNPLTLIEEGRS